MCLGANARNPIQTSKCPVCKTRTARRPAIGDVNYLTERLHKLVFDVEKETTARVLGCENISSIPAVRHPMDFVCEYRQLFFVPSLLPYGSMSVVRLENDFTRQDASKVAEYVTPLGRKIHFLLVAVGLK